MALTISLKIMKAGDLGRNDNMVSTGIRVDRRNRFRLRPARAPNDTGPSFRIRPAPVSDWNIGKASPGTTAGGVALAVDVAQGLPSGTILSLAAGGPGDLWIGTDRGLCRLHDGQIAERSFTIEKHGLPSGCRHLPVPCDARDSLCGAGTAALFWPEAGSDGRFVQPAGEAEAFDCPLTQESRFDSGGFGTWPICRGAITADKIFWWRLPGAECSIATIGKLHS